MSINLVPLTASRANGVSSESLSPDGLTTLCQSVCDRGGRLVSLWASDRRADAEPAFVLSVALQNSDGLRVAQLTLDPERPEYPDLSAIFPAAARLQRATYDLLGVKALADDQRPWLRHGAWRSGEFPLRRDAAIVASDSNDTYPFVRVTGDGVHEIAVGPIHAGIIEPGHFRFSVVGEKLLRLEERLGYVHKGIEKRFETLSLEDGARLAARISGDSAVAFSWAYCMALENITGTTAPPRAAWLRALCLELERIANHLGDLGALGNDVGFAFGLAQFSRLKEDLLRVNAGVFGRRYLFDAVVPGGAAIDLEPTRVPILLATFERLAAEVATLREIYDNHAGVQDRFIGAGVIGPDLAARLGVVGLAGRASGQAWDLRCDAPVPPYAVANVRRALRTQGDVAARVTVRFEELIESFCIGKQLLETLPQGPVRVALRPGAPNLTGYGWVEGWRGPVFVALTSGADGGIARCHPLDPSWHNWPALEHAVIGNIVPDFPLINKSFNLSYSGHDL